MWINKNTVSLHYPLGMGTGNHSLRSRYKKALSTRTEGFKYKDKEALSTRNKKKKTVDFYDKQEQD